MHLDAPYALVKALLQAVLSTEIIRHFDLWLCQRLDRSFYISAAVSLKNRMSDTRSQGCTDLQSLINCLEYRNIASDTVRNQAKLCKAGPGCSMKVPWIAS